jgi:hypothetical protein
VKLCGYRRHEPVAQSLRRMTQPEARNVGLHRRSLINVPGTLPCSGRMHIRILVAVPYAGALPGAPLHRRVGGSAVMAAQLGKVLELAQDGKAMVKQDRNFVLWTLRSPCRLSYS